MLLIHICSISVIAWELDTNLKIVRADCQFELRANREITPRPEGLYIRQRAIRVRDCASIIPECAFLLSIEEFFCWVWVCPLLHHCPAIPTWHEISGSNDHFCNSSISGAPSAFFVLQKFSWNMLCRMPTRPSQIWCSGLFAGQWTLNLFSTVSGNKRWRGVLIVNSWWKTVKQVPWNMRCQMQTTKHLTGCHELLILFITALANSCE